jgi:hypothetical protein
VRTLLLLVTIECSLLAQHTVSVRWSDTPTLLGNQPAIARLASGVRLEGEWRSVTPTSFTMSVRKSSGSPSQKGTVTVDRADLEYLSFRPVRFKGRVTGLVAGFPLGAMLGGGLTATSDGARAAGAIGMIIGYGLGRIRDRTPISVFILPDDAPLQPPGSRRQIPPHPRRLRLEDAIGHE